MGVGSSSQTAKIAPPDNCHLTTHGHKTQKHARKVVLSARHWKSETFILKRKKLSNIDEPRQVNGRNTKRRVDPSDERKTPSPMIKNQATAQHDTAGMRDDVKSFFAEKSLEMVRQARCELGQLTKSTGYAWDMSSHKKWPTTCVWTSHARVLSEPKNNYFVFEYRFKCGETTCVVLMALRDGPEMESVFREAAVEVLDEFLTQKDAYEATKALCARAEHREFFRIKGKNEYHLRIVLAHRINVSAKSADTMSLC